jgi:alpha-galactosidase
VFAYVQLASSATEAPGAARLPGLDPALTYTVTPVSFGGGAGGAGVHSIHTQAPGWLANPATASAVPGTLLGHAGLPMPVLHPEELLLLHLTAV